MRSFDLPIAIGPSRKLFLKKEGELETEFATAAAVAASILSGAHIVRVHDVKAMKVVAEVTDVIQQAREQQEEKERMAAEAASRPKVRPVDVNDGREPMKAIAAKAEGYGAAQ